MSPDPAAEPVTIIGGPPRESPSIARQTHDRIRERIRELLEFGTDKPDSLRDAARELGVLPLASESAQRWYGVRPDGDLLSFALRAPHDERVVEDQWRRSAELSRASERYPELEALVYPPPLSCRTCPRCGGEGRIRLHGESVTCLCGGLGWLPPVEDEIGTRKGEQSPDETK
jgi:hypothetical protein